MTKHHSEISDEKIDQAYQSALNELEPNALVEQRIKKAAHAQVKAKTSDWASFPMWARAASVAGVAVLGWWLYQPAEQVAPPSTFIEFDSPQAITSEAMPPTQTEEMRYQAMTEQPERMATQSVASIAADSTSFALPKQQTEQQSKQQSLAVEPQSVESCLAQIIPQQMQAQELQALPQELASQQAEQKHSIHWNNQEWQLRSHGSEWYLIQPDGTPQQGVKIPPAIWQQCKSPAEN